MCFTSKNVIVLALLRRSSKNRLPRESQQQYNIRPLLAYIFAIVLLSAAEARYSHHL